MHLIAFLPRRGLGDRHLRQLLNQALEDPPPDLGMRHLAPAEEDRRLDLVPVGQEALDVLLLELVVVLVDLRSEFDFLTSMIFWCFLAERARFCSWYW